MYVFIPLTTTPPPVLCWAAISLFSPSAGLFLFRVVYSLVFRLEDLKPVCIAWPTRCLANYFQAVVNLYKCKDCADKVQVSKFS